MTVRARVLESLYENRKVRQCWRAGAAPGRQTLHGSQAIVKTIIAQSGQDRQDPPGPRDQASAECGKFIQLAPPRPERVDATCARCGRPDFAHEADKRDRLARLADLDEDRLVMALTWLAGYRPAVFDAVLDATEPRTGDDHPDDSEPYCRLCGAQVGVFFSYGNDWRHFRGTPGSKVELFDAGHIPVIGWRPATVTVVTT